MFLKEKCHLLDGGENGAGRKTLFIKNDADCVSSLCFMYVYLYLHTYIRRRWRGERSGFLREKRQIYSRQPNERLFPLQISLFCSRVTYVSSISCSGEFSLSQTFRKLTTAGSNHKRPFLCASLHHRQVLLAQNLRQSGKVSCFGISLFHYCRLFGLLIVIKDELENAQKMF